MWRHADRLGSRADKRVDHLGWCGKDSERFERGSRLRCHVGRKRWVVRMEQARKFAKLRRRGRRGSALPTLSGAPRASEELAKGALVHASEGMSRLDEKD